MTPLSQSEADTDEKTRLLGRSVSGSRLSKESLRGLDVPSHKENALGVPRPSAKPKFSDMSGKDGCYRSGDSGIASLDDSSTVVSQAEGTRGRFKGFPWSQSKQPQVTGPSPEKSPSKTTMEALEEGVRYHVAKIKSKVGIKWPKAQESREDEEFKRACVDDLNKRTRDSSFGVHAPSEPVRHLFKDAHRRKAEQTAAEGSTDAKTKTLSIESRPSSSHHRATPLTDPTPANPSSSNDLCTSSTTNREDSHPPSQSTGVDKPPPRGERLKQSSDWKDHKNTTNSATRKESQRWPKRNPWMRSESADYDSVTLRSNFRPPLARAASASSASSDAAKSTATRNGRGALGSGDSEQGPTESKSFFSIEYLKANLKLDLKLPDLPFPKSFKGEESSTLRQKSKSQESDVSPDRDRTGAPKPDDGVTASRPKMTDEATNTKSQTPRYLRLGSHVHEAGRGRARPLSSQDKSDKLTQRKPKHPPQNIRRAPSNRQGIVSVNSGTQTSPITVQMVDLGDLQSPPGHPDFDVTHRPWHASSTPSCLWSPRGNGSVETLVSDDPEEYSDTSHSSSSSLQDWQQFRQLSPITEADNSSESEENAEKLRKMNSIGSYEDSRNCYPEEMLRHKSFQRVQDEDSPLSHSLSRDELNPMSPRYLSPTSLCNNRLTIPGMFGESMISEPQQAPSLGNWARGYRSTGSFSALESPKIVVQSSAVSRSFDASYTSRAHSGRNGTDDYRKKNSIDSSPRTLRRASNLNVASSSIHRSHTDSRLFDHESNQHEPLVRQRSDSAAFVRGSKRSPESRRLSDYKQSSRSPSGDDLNGRRGRNSPKVERRRSDSYDSSPRRSPEKRCMSDQKSSSHSSRSPSSDETNGRRRRHSPKTEEHKKSRSNLLRQTPTLNNDMFDDDIPSLGTRWFDVDEDWGSLSSCVFNDNGMVVSTKRTKSFDHSAPSGSRTPEGRKRSSLSPRDDRRDSVNRHGDLYAGFDHDKKRARSFDLSTQNAHRSSESKKRSSLSPRDDRRESSSRLGDPFYDQDRQRARSFDSSGIFDPKKRNLSPRTDRRESFNRNGDNGANGHEQGRKSPVSKRNHRRVEALSPLITISRSFDERVSGGETSPKECPRRRRTTGSLTLEAEHHPVPELPTRDAKADHHDHSGRRSKFHDRIKGRGIMRVSSDESNRRFIPLERQDRPRRVYSAPSASSPPPSPLYPTVHIVPPPESVPRVIDFDNQPSRDYEHRNDGDGRRGDFNSVITIVNNDKGQTTRTFHSTPVINIDAFETQGSVEEKGGGREGPSLASWDACNRKPVSARRAVMAENRSFDLPSVAGSCAVPESTHRRAASFSSFSHPTREGQAIWNDYNACADDDKEDDDICQLETDAGSEANRCQDETESSASYACQIDGYPLPAHVREKYFPLIRSASTANPETVSRSGSSLSRQKSTDFGAASSNRPRAPVRRSLTDSDVIVDADRKRRLCIRSTRVTSLDSNPLPYDSPSTAYHNGGSSLRHMSDDSSHVNQTSDALQPSTCALRRDQFTTKPQTPSLKSRSRSYDVACDATSHRDSLAEACSSVKKAVCRKSSSPISCSSSSSGSNANQGNANPNSNNNLLSIPTWNTTLGKFSNSDSRLAVPGQNHCTPLKKTSSVPPDFPENGNPRSSRSTSLHTSPGFQHSRHSGNKTIRHHSTDESAFGREGHLHQSHLYGNASHSTPHIATVSPSNSLGDGRFSRHGSSSRSGSLGGRDSHYSSTSHSHHQQFPGTESPKSLRSSDNRRTYSQDYSGRYDLRDSLTDSQIFEQLECEPDRSQGETAPEDVETTPLLSGPMAGAVDGRGIEIIVSDENDTRVSTVQTGKRAVFRRIWMVLLDNRMAGRPDCERALRPHPEEYRVLKRILNIVFITVGVALLVSVFVVIIYTYVVDPDDKRGRHDNSRARHAAHATIRPVVNVTSFPQLQ